MVGAKGFARVEGFFLPVKGVQQKKLIRTIPASNFVATLAANVENAKLTDAEFRQLVRNTLSIVQYDGCDEKKS